MFQADGNEANLAHSMETFARERSKRMDGTLAWVRETLLRREAVLEPRVVEARARRRAT